MSRQWRNMTTPLPPIDVMNNEAPPPLSAAAESDPLEQELAQQKDVHLRLAADFESRAAAQKESFIAELLPVIDNLERALAAGASAGSEQFRQGVEMTLQQLRLLLGRHGIVSDEIVGQPFDPHQHEAISQRHDPAQADHTILDMFQRGYRRGAKVLRPAKVVVNDLTSAPPPRPAR